MKKEIITIDTLQGHLVLYCKNHYNVKNVDFLIGLRRIWAIRCGYNYRDNDKSCDRYIANEFYRIFKQLNPRKAEYFFEILHEEILNEWKYEGLNSLERLIMAYRNELMMIIIREKIGNKWHNLIQLPKVRKQVFKRIVRGNGKYDDYKLLVA